MKAGTKGSLILITLPERAREPLFALMQQLQPKKEPSELKERISSPPRTLFPRIQFKDADRIMRATAKGGVEFIFKPLEDTSEEFDPEEVRIPQKPSGLPLEHRQASTVAHQESSVSVDSEGKKKTALVTIGLLLVMVAGIYYLFESGALEPVIAFINGL